MVSDMGGAKWLSNTPYKYEEIEPTGWVWCTCQSEEALADLQGCFELTDWETLYKPYGEEINEPTDSITDYINLCTKTITQM